MTERELVPLDFELVRDEYEQRWARANTDEASIEILDEGVFRVTLADGDDTHDVLFAEQGERDVGHCDCDGFAFHTTDGKGPCAHLCVLGKLTVFDEIPVSPVDELASTRATNRALRLATGCGLASMEEIEGRDVVREQNGDLEEVPA